MKKFNFLICYDISDVKRLRKVAKLLEQNSIRIQKSIFYVTFISKDDLIKVIDKLKELIDKKDDDVRIYKVDKYSSLHLKSAVNLKQPHILGV